MQRLSPKNLCMIFQKLETPLDLERCSAVSKHWAAGIYKTRPTTLRFCCCHSDVTSSKFVGEIRWLQTWHKHRRLQQVKDLNLEDEVPYECSDRISYFSQSLILCAGLCNLRSCSLAGPFSIQSAVELLPTSLQSLSLRPNSGPADFCLSAFQRFTCLESLTLSYCFLLVERVGSEPASCHFHLDRCFIRTLHLLDCLPLLQDHFGYDLNCSLDSNFSLQECLPALDSLLVGLVYDKNSVEQVVEFACSVASWHGFHRLQLELMQIDTADFANAHNVVLNSNPDLVIAAKQSIIELFKALNRAAVNYDIKYRGDCV